MEMADALTTEFGDKTVDELILNYQNQRLNLQPGFQRRSVWSISDRRRLIESILQMHPIPGIFLYQRHEHGNIIYDVIDGKQRLETLLMFTRQRGFGGLSFEVHIDGRSGPEKIGWKQLQRKYPEKASMLRAFKIQTIELRGDLSDIVDVFVKINSTGKPLTSGEKRHARFYNSPFLKAAEKLTNRYRDFLLHSKILSEVQLSRMKGTELFSELLMSIHHKGIINKKVALDLAIGNEKITSTQIIRISDEFVSTLNTLKNIIPELRTLRLHNSAEFYTLFMLVWEMREQKMILTDVKSRKLALGFLTQLSNGVDELQIKLRKAKPADPGDQLFADYLLTVQGNTDSAPIRQRRAELLRGLVFPLFEKKDEQRLFSSEQRRLLWHSADARSCAKCSRGLRWDEITVDHVFAHSKGGKTSLDNAQILCHSCNSSKGKK